MMVMQVGHRYHRLQFQLIVIALFSVGLLGGYMFHASPHHRPMTFNTRKTLAVTPTAVLPSDTEPPAAVGQRGQFSVVSVGSPLPLVLVDEKDSRHPENIKKMISGQSHQEEHKAGILDALIKGRSDATVSSDNTTAAAAVKAENNAVAAIDGKAVAIAKAAAEEKAAEAAEGTADAKESLDSKTEAVAEAAAGAKAAAADVKTAAADVKAAASAKARTGKKAETLVSASAADGEEAAAKTAEALANAEAATAQALAAKKSTEALASAAAAKAAVAIAEKDAAEADTAAAAASAAGLSAAGKVAGGGDGKAHVEAVATHAVEHPTTGMRPEIRASDPGCAKPGAGCGMDGSTIHTLFTSNGSPYQNFQARIMVATWRIARAQPSGSHMVAMTRILHRTTTDELMEEVDTFRANPLQPECDKWCWFPVADRANAMQQWMDAVEKEPSIQKAPWILLLETDYVWIKPLPVTGDAYDLKVPGLAYRFDYINPLHPVVGELLKIECPTCDKDSVPASGPAPVMARFEDFKAATPMWEKLSTWIETHEHAKKALGWVREMYAWNIGVAASHLNIRTERNTETTLISQPPHDHLPYNASMYHYTWGSIYMDENQTKIWSFDKRFYTTPEEAYKVPHLALPPPWRPGIRLHDGMTITENVDNTLRHMITLMNAGSATLPDLTQHAQKLLAAAKPVS